MELHFEAHALGAFAKTSDRRKTEFDRAKTTASQIEVGSDSFGHIPGIGRRVYKAYDEHQRSCADGIGSAAEAMASIAAAVRDVMLNYTGTEGAITDDVKTVRNDLRDVHVRGA